MLLYIFLLKIMYNHMCWCYIGPVSVLMPLGMVHLHQCIEYIHKNASRGQKPYQSLLPSLALSLVVPSVPSKSELTTDSSDDDRCSGSN